uniref:Protein kinase-like domain, beta-lactamase/transpeptidase-like protein n=1 Tax=Tanacetum cinerariifolium TaxID=118510 RepID=A0A6L2NSZ9_TANCI|nr:protein kinase-like domain, beta-lactamase/transpeptidase-like protein [Tanacetum cinerariifolium]
MRKKGYETCEEDEGYGEEDKFSSSEEYGLEDDCEAELDEITETLDPHRDIEVVVGIEAVIDHYRTTKQKRRMPHIKNPEKVLEQHGDGEENNHHDGKETYLDNSDVDSLDEEIIEDGTVELRRTLVRFPRYDEKCKIVTFSIGQSFTDHKQFKRALLKYAVQEKRDYIFKKNARHTCSKVFQISHVKSPWIVEQYEAMIYAHLALVDTNPGTSVDIEIEHIGCGEQMKLAFYSIAKCANEAQLRQRLDEIDIIQTGAKQSLENKDINQWSRSKNPFDYLDQCYSKEKFIAAYNHPIKVVGSEEFWPNSDRGELSPPLSKPMPGRPKKAIRRRKVHPPRMMQVHQELEPAASVRNDQRKLLEIAKESGTKVNYNKSKIYGIGVNEGDMTDMARWMGCDIREFAFMYLGLSVGENMRRVNAWGLVVENFKKRLAD